MNTRHLCALALTCVVSASSFGQQKTFNWVAADDETVSLDPATIMAGPRFKRVPKLRMFTSMSTRSSRSGSPWCLRKTGMTQPRMPKLSEI